MWDWSIGRKFDGRELEIFSPYQMGGVFRFRLWFLFFFFSIIILLFLFCLHSLHLTKLAVVQAKWRIAMLLLAFGVRFLLYHLLFLFCIILRFVGKGNAGITSTFIRSEWPSVDIPLDNDIFSIPKVHNAPQQVSLLCSNPVDFHTIFSIFIYVDSNWTSRLPSLYLKTVL